MATALVENEKLVESTSAASIAQGVSSSKNNSTVDKDQFLQLLVAQMKYQDPLEPTSNTEYISQYATFSELEQMQNMSASLELARASSLVGQTVVMKVTDSTGNTTVTQGNVDYVVYENNKAYLSINGELYSMDSLDTVADQNYLNSYQVAGEWINAYNKLPSLGLLTIDHEEAVTKLKEDYDNMSDYSKKFLTDDYVEGLEKYVARMEELKKAAEEKNDKDTGADADTEEDASDKEETKTE